jgi:hypothetical protein
MVFLLLSVPVAFVNPFAAIAVWFLAASAQLLFT